MDAKRCTTCGVEKPLDEYYDNPGRRAGKVAACKDCTKQRVKIRRRLNPAVQAYDRERGARRDTKDVRAYRAANPEKYRAHTAVGNALRDGKLKREPCLFCGEQRVHGHHRDYSKPLDVIWLCAKCHHRLHANFPETAAHEQADREAA